MLEPPDAYRLGRHLRASGAVAEIEDVYAKYAHVSMLAEGIPIFLMNTVGADHACVFLKERRCTICHPTQESVGEGRHRPGTQGQREDGVVRRDDGR